MIFLYKVCGGRENILYATLIEDNKIKYKKKKY